MDTTLSRDLPWLVTNPYIFSLDQLPSIPRARPPSVFCWVDSTHAADGLETLPVENSEGSVFLSSNCHMKELANTATDSEHLLPPCYDTGGGQESLVPS